MAHYLDVPYFKQDTDYSCGPASLEMILGYFGIRRSERDLMHELHSNSEVGSRHQRIINALTGYGLHVYVNNESSIEEVAFYLEQELPVLVHYIEPTTDEGHYSVVVGMPEADIVLNDPYNGERFRMTQNAFEKRWKDEDGEFVRWMLAASDESLSLGKQFHPK